MDKIMKKGFLIAILIAIAGSVFAQTGTGWGQVRFKSNFKDSVNIANGWMIDGTVITPTAIQINHSTGVTSNIQTQLNARGRVATITTNILAGEETDVTLTGVTAEPYSLYIIDADGLNITDAVKDSTAISGGVYHTYIY